MGSIGGKTRTLHRAVFEHVNGWLPPSRGETVISHTCEVSLCLEAKHLIAETQQENLLRRSVINHPNAAKNQCPEGHEYDVIYKSGRRGCRACDNARSRRNYALRKAQ